MVLTLARLLGAGGSDSKTGFIFAYFLDPVLGYFCAIKWTSNGSKIRSNIGKKRIPFWIPFLEVLEVFGCLLGAVLGLPRLYWTTLDPKNLKKILMVV